MQLENEWIRISFDKSCNNITQLINLSTHENYIKKKPAGPIFELVALNSDNQKVTCFPGMPDHVSEAKNSLIMCYTSMNTSYGSAKVECKLQIELHQQEINVSLDITNFDDSLYIVETLCPMVGRIYLGNSYQDDIILYPHHAGEKTKNPVEEYASERYKSFFRAQTQHIDSIYHREINYCGLASMTWMYYYDEENGLYIGSHDAGFPVTGIIANTGGPDDPWMGFGFRKHYRISAGESFHSATYCIGISCEDWHWGAAKYRGWIEPYLEFNNNPAFLQDEVALNQCYNFKKDGALLHRFEDIPSMFDRGMEYGVRHMFIASWNRMGFDCNYPEYYPDMELGTAMDICRGIEYVNRRGGFATFYINARLFDKKSDYFPTVGEKMAIKNHRQEVLTETYGPVEFSLNCPSDVAWQKQLVDTAVFAVKAYGLKGIYLDQLGSAEPFACYHEGHSHLNIGEFNQGYLAILAQLKRELKRLDAESFIMTENCGDIYGSYTWGNLTWNGVLYDEFFNMFKYTFPEYVQVNMVNPRSWIKNAEEQMAYFYKDIERAVLLGSILWLGLTNRFVAESEAEVYMKKVLGFRRLINLQIKECRYQDQRYVSHTDTHLEVSVWESDSTVLILVGNHIGQPGTVKIELPFPYKIERCFNEDCNDSTVAAEGQGKVLYIKIGNNKLTAFMVLKQ